jgi:hypothetical protein
VIEGAQHIGYLTQALQHRFAVVRCGSIKAGFSRARFGFQAGFEQRLGKLSGQSPDQ